MYTGGLTSVSVAAIPCRLVMSLPFIDGIAVIFRSKIFIVHLQLVVDLSLSGKQGVATYADVISGVCPPLRSTVVRASARVRKAGI